MPIKSPLQKELERDLQESLNLIQDAITMNDNEMLQIAQDYYNAIKRINDICVNRNRY